MLVSNIYIRYRWDGICRDTVILIVGAVPVDISVGLEAVSLDEVVSCCQFSLKEFIGLERNGVFSIHSNLYYAQFKQYKW